MKKPKRILCAVLALLMLLGAAAAVSVRPAYAAKTEAELEEEQRKAARTQRGSERGGGTEYDVQRAQHVCPGKHAHKVREETAQRDAHNGVRHKHGQQREGLAHTGLYGAKGDGGEHEAHSGVERRNERAADDGSGFCLFHGTVFLSGSILPHRCRRAGGVVRAKARRAQNPTEGTAF